MDILSVIIYSAILFWMVKQLKAVLFWLYLWQLKDYHLSRFIAHFSTIKGRQIFLNKLYLFKIIWAAIFFAAASFSFLLWWSLPLVVLYLLEAFKASFGLASGKIKKPVWTGKAVVLFLFSSSLFFYFFASFFYLLQASFIFLEWLLVLDILAPVFVSGVVLTLQPVTVFLRNRVISKAMAKRRQFKDLIVIGVTGSCGKSSAKEFLAAILSQKYKVGRTPKNQNSEMGISNTILKLLKPEHQIFVCEMGAYNAQGIELLTKIAQPQIGILVSINQQHLATFGNQKNIIKGKFKLIENLPENGTAILNGDNEFVKKELSRRKFKVKKIKKYSIKGEADIWAENIEVKKDKVSFEVFSRDGEFARFEINLPGGWPIVSNILAAAAAAKELKMSLAEIHKACQKIDASFAPVAVKQSASGLNIIDSSYSANPEGALADLDYLNLWIGKKIVVMPSLIELGPAIKEAHQKIGEKIGQVCDLAIITSRDGLKEVKIGALNKGLKPDRIFYSENPQKIVEIIKKETQKGDTVLLEGRVPEGVLRLLDK
ncbi:MAG: UDP-N-acetylmuramoyl-tripeptide--D-alanyl-D-alanine ligase [Candidatus Paceibacterota bacterium]|jgi:UDP-N-acetylmuramoyl-tripeptide--D-alanyl-D-alanine ligase